jgi:prepilin-type processing-associated H-X9-DG protein
MWIDNPVTFHAPQHKVLENGKWIWYYYPFQLTMATIPTSQIIVSGDAQWMFVGEGITTGTANFHNSTDRVNLLFMDGHVVYTQMQFGVAVTSDYSEQPFPVVNPPGP